MDHSRTSSADSASSSSTSSSVSTAASCIRLLDAVLTHPVVQEMPLRTMYTLNCTPRSSPLTPPPVCSSSSAGSGPHHGSGPSSAAAASASSFSSSLMAQISQLPTHPSSLPPAFVTSFLTRTFTPQLDRIDFCQALTGLDYLKDLEHRRRREVAAALRRLAIDRDMLALPPAALGTQHPALAGWIGRVEQHEQTAESLYTSLYLGLRQWIMINEMSLAPFNKNNCHAMLNTLFPPVICHSPGSVAAAGSIGQDVLQAQRAAFFRYIKAVEVQGSSVLDPLIRSGSDDGAGAATGWTAVHDVLLQYLDLANGMIRQCQAVGHVDLPSVSSSMPASPSASATSLHSAGSALASPDMGSGGGGAATAQAGHYLSPSLDSIVSRPDTASSRTSSGQHGGADGAVHIRGTSLASTGSGPYPYPSPPSPVRKGPLPPLPAVVSSQAPLPPPPAQPAPRSKPTALTRLAREFRRITSSAKRLEVDEIISQPPSPAPVVAMIQNELRQQSQSQSHANSNSNYAVPPPPPTPTTGAAAAPGSGPGAVPTRPSGFRGMTLRKMKSFGGLSDLRNGHAQAGMGGGGATGNGIASAGAGAHSGGVSPARTPEPFDKLAMAKQRMLWERRNGGVAAGAGAGLAVPAASR